MKIQVVLFVITFLTAILDHTAAADERRLKGSKMTKGAKSSSSEKEEKSKKSKGLKGFTTDPKLPCSLTCEACPIGCKVTYCSPDPILLPPKSDFFPPVEILARPYGPEPSFPANLTAEYEWWTTHVLAEYPKMIPQSDTEWALTSKEIDLVKMELSEWMIECASGEYTCMELAKALTKRALYLQHVQHMNHFMYWGTFDWIEVVLKEAKAMDKLAKKHGNDALAPLYCYPIPLKGTMSTIDFPSSVGFAAALHTYHSKVDAALVSLIKDAHGVQFGKTNVPEFARSYRSGNYANGIAMNPWGHDKMTGGSSGGSAAAVAAYTTTIAVTEDTGGSTNTPATRNHLFVYDPPKFHYPNAGNPSITDHNDQLGVNARSIDDIIAFDKAVLLGTQAEHDAAKAFVAGLSNVNIKIGCSDIFYDYDAMSDAINAKYDEAKSVLEDAGFSFINSCSTDDPTISYPSTLHSSAIAFWEMEYHLKNNLDLDINIFDVLLNGNYCFGTTYCPVRGWFSANIDGCSDYRDLNQTLIDAYLGDIPAERSNSYNEYFDTYSVDLLMGPTHYCDDVLWTDDISLNCDNGRYTNGSCMSNCHSLAVRGSKDKMFSKAKFVVPIGRLTDAGEPMSLHFMTCAGPRNPTVPASEWVLDEEGPKTWNLEEIYMVKRITEVLADAGMVRADAPMNFISGLL